MYHVQKRQWMVLVFIALAALLAACTTPGAQARPVDTPVSAQATPEPEAEGCSLVYAYEQQVFCQRSFAVRDTLATVDGPFVALSLSQDGLFVAYTVMRDDGTVSLGVVSTDGKSEAREVVSSDLGTSAAVRRFSVFQLQWRAGTHVLYFNTVPAYEKDGFDPSVLSGAHLFTLNADTGELAKVVEREGAGRFSLSPDGKHAVLSLPEALEVMDLETGARTQVLEFAAIDNATPTGYLPRADWSADAASFNVAIPQGAVFTADGKATLYRVSLDGKVQTLGSLQGSFMAGGPIEFEFSPDGTQVAYGTFDRVTQEATVHVAKSDGSADRLVAMFGREHGLQGLGWSPDSAQYTFSILPDGGVLFAGLAGSGETIAAGQMVVAAKWTSSDSLVFTDGSSLYLHRPGESIRRIAGGENGGMLFDLRPEPPAPAAAQN